MRTLERGFTINRGPIVIGTEGGATFANGAVQLSEIGEGVETKASRIPVYLDGIQIGFFGYNVYIHMPGGAGVSMVFTSLTTRFLGILPLTIHLKNETVWDGQGLEITIPNSTASIILGHKSTSV